MTHPAVLGRALDAVANLAEGGAPWAELLKGACDVVGGDSASLIMLDARKEVVTIETYGISDAAVAQYIAHFGSLDVVTPMAMGAREGAWLDTAEMFPQAVLERNEYYADYMCPHGMRQMLTHIVRERPTDHGGLSVQRQYPRRHSRVGFERPEVRQFVGALAAAIETRRTQAGQWMDMLEASFGPLGEAVCVVTRTGTVVHMTPTAKALFAQRTGIECRMGQAWHPQQAVRAALHAGICDAATTRERVSLTLPGKEGLRGEVDIAPAPGLFNLGSLALVLLRVRLIEKGRAVAGGAFRFAYGLTQAEEMVLAALVAGQTPAGYAAAKGLSIHTVRKQIAVIKEKVGCSRTVDLVVTAIGRG